jgi:hypothetical protein
LKKLDTRQEKKHAPVRIRLEKIGYPARKNMHPFKNRRRFWTKETSNDSVPPLMDHEKKGADTHPQIGIKNRNCAREASIQQHVQHPSPSKVGNACSLQLDFFLQANQSSFFQHDDPASAVRPSRKA